MDLQVYFRIPGEWAAVLKNIQAVAPEAFIAGGCLRDYWNDKPVNDIDIFVPASKGLATAVKLTHAKKTKSIPEPYLTHDNNVRYIDYYEDLTCKLPPVNLIGVSDEVCNPSDQLERFDFGICRVAYDGVTLWQDLSYHRDIRAKTFTLKEGQTEEQLKFSLGRFNRLSLKYPGFKLVRTARWPFDDKGAL